MKVYVRARNPKAEAVYMAPNVFRIMAVASFDNGVMLWLLEGGAIRAFTSHSRDELDRHAIYKTVYDSQVVGL